jgi:peptidoglycan/LPS O-acetylase OafA/YrhL
MVKENNSRSFLLDFLKGIAIIAVILFHYGVLEQGYLGVEVFLVIGGYLITKSILAQIELNRFSYWSFIGKRLVRLWPLTLIVSSVAFILGWYIMFPWTFKLNCESVAATSLFANNIVQYITTGDYWDSSNATKPLMHTWYVAIIMQFYVVYPIVFILTKKISKDWHERISDVLWWILGLSLLLYVSPLTTPYQDFYLLPSRLFEFAAGGLIAVTQSQTPQNNRIKPLLLGIIIFILILLVVNIDITKLRLILAVIVSSLIVYIISNNKLENSTLLCLKPIAFLGLGSYSLYLWHQVIFAYYKILFGTEIQSQVVPSIMLIAVVIMIGVLSYQFIEKPLTTLTKHNRKNIIIVNTVSAFFAILLVVVSSYYYKHNGVVRDIPEFEISKAAPFRLFPSQYSDRTAKLDVNFPKNGRKNILVLGDSYGRDWVNILRESGVDKKMNISYHMGDDSIGMARIPQADVIFIVSNIKWIDKYPHLTASLFDKKFYRVGTKGIECNPENLYILHHNDKNYYKIRRKVPKEKYTINDEEERIYKNRYIKLINVLTDKNGLVPVFSDDKKFLFIDSGHLTRAGVLLYAQKLNVWKYLE